MDMKEKSVLIIDDNELFAKTLAVYFKAKGFSVFVFDEMEKLKLFLSEKNFQSVQLAVVDFNLKGCVSGEDIALFLEKKFPDIKIILVSGCFPETSGNYDLKSNRELLPKPFDINELEEVLEKNNVFFS